MQWEEHKKNGYIEIAGTRYPLDHLTPHAIKFEFPAKDGHRGIELGVVVEYTSHCISRGAPHGGSIDFAAIGHDHKIIDEQGRPRRFEQERYDLSFQIAEALKTLDKRSCFIVGHKCWLTFGDGLHGAANDPYEIHFGIWRTKARPTILRLRVRSAYVPDPGKGSPRLGRKYSGKQLLLAKATGERIRGG